VPEPRRYEKIPDRGPGGFDGQLLGSAEELRQEGMALGTSELLDAFAALEQIPWTDQSEFWGALSATLAKSPDDARVFELRTYYANPGKMAALHARFRDHTCKLFEKEAPETVKNFIELAEGKREWKDRISGKKGPGPLYVSTPFHRVIPHFMIHDGEPSGTGTGGPGYQFADETKGSPHKFDKAGKLAMANAGPNTNGSQFFITVAPTPWLNGKHTIFGEVVSGQDVVDSISQVPRDDQDKPTTPVKILRISIRTVRATPAKPGTPGDSPKQPH